MSSNAHPADIGLAPTPQHADDLKEPHVEAKGVSEQASTPKSEESSPDSLPSIPIPASTPKSEESSPDSLPSIPITANKANRTMPIILIGSNWAATILLLVFIFHPVYYSASSNLVTERFATMLLCVSLPATFIGLFTANQMRRLYIQRYVHLHQQGQLKPRDRERCTASVGVSGFKEDLRSWRIGLSYLAAGLITASMVSCLTPTITSVSFLPSARIYPNHDKDSCFTAGTNRSELSTWSWQLQGASYLGINRNASIECESEKLGNVVSALSAKDYSYAYAIGGLLVDRAALGAPIDPAGNPAGEFGTINRHPDFLWATQCFPSLTSNPVRCRAAPEAEFNVTTKSLGISINGCNSTNDVLKVDPTVDGATVFAVCPDEKKFGALSLAFGAVNDAATLWATGMQDHSFDVTETSYDSLNRSRISYAVKCSIDIASSVSYRQMTLARRIGYLTGMVDNFLYHIIGDRSVPCTPKDPSGADIPLSTFLTERALIVGAVSPRVLVLENVLMDGTMMMLHKFVSMFNPDRAPENDPKQVYTFEESQNALEDALGTLSGMALGMYWGAQTWNGSTGAVEITNGKGGSSGWRMGTGQPWNVIYAIPTLASAIVLSYLLYRGIRDGHV